MSGASAYADVCDVDADGDIDRTDIGLIFDARNQPATGAEDPRDADANGVINVLDGRQCVLQCTNTGCASNTPPIADAGPDQAVDEGNTVTLSGSASSDAEGDPLTFSWSLSVPTGSRATLSDPTAVIPTFVIDVPGEYIAQLIVNDGTVDSAPDTVTSSTGNMAPVADAGQNQTVDTGDAVTLDGSGSSDVDGDPLTFAWSLTSVPADSTAELSDPTVVMPTIVADLAGTYVAQLIVNDGQVDSEPDSVVVTTEMVPEGTLTCGDLVSSSIVETGEVDIFSFSGNEGDDVALTITGSQVVAKVFGPSGTEITGFFGSTQTLLTLPESGTYVVEVVGRAFSATGGYNLGLECL